MQARTPTHLVGGDARAHPASADHDPPRDLSLRYGAGHGFRVVRVVVSRVEVMGAHVLQLVALGLEPRGQFLLEGQAGMVGAYGYSQSIGSFCRRDRISAGEVYLRPAATVYTAASSKPAACIWHMLPCSDTYLYADVAAMTP